MKIAIIGLGVIGGSLGLAIKQNNPRMTVVGFDSSAVLRRAKKRKAIDRSAPSLRSAVSEADIVFLCTPVKSIVKLLPAVSKFISSTAIVTDVGSVKGVVQTGAKKYFTTLVSSSAAIRWRGRRGAASSMPTAFFFKMPFMSFVRPSDERKQCSRWQRS